MKIETETYSVYITNFTQGIPHSHYNTIKKIE